MKNVLLVDDDTTFNFISTKLLQRTGIVNDIHTAQDGQQALNLFNDYFQGLMPLPDIILLDLNMPIIDGFEFLEAFMKLNLRDKSKVKIIIVSSSHSQTDIEKAKRLGAHQYLRRPLDEKSLLEVLGL